MSESALDQVLAKSRLLEEKRRHAREDIPRNEWGEDLNLLDDAKKSWNQQGARATRKLKLAQRQDGSSHSLFAWTLALNRNDSRRQEHTAASSSSDLECEHVSQHEVKVTCVSFAGHSGAVMVGDERGFLCMWRRMGSKWRRGNKLAAHDRAVLATDCVLTDASSPCSFVFSFCVLSTAVKVWTLTGVGELELMSCVETKLSSPLSLCRSFLVSRSKGEGKDVMFAVSSNVGETRLFLFSPVGGEPQLSGDAGVLVATDGKHNGGGASERWRGVGELQGHRSNIVLLDVFCLQPGAASSMSKRTLITASLDGKVRLWSMRTQEEGYRWECLCCLDNIVNTSMQPQPYCTYEVLPGILVVGQRSALQVWHLKLQEEEGRLSVSKSMVDEKKEHISDVCCIAARCDGCLLLSSDVHGHVIVWCWKKDEDDDEKLQLVPVRSVLVSSGAIAFMKFNRVFSTISRVVMVFKELFIKIFDTKRIMEVDDDSSLFLVDVFYPDISSPPPTERLQDARYIKGRWHQDAYVDEKEKFYSMRENVPVVLDADRQVVFATVDVPDGAVRMWHHNFEKNRIKYLQDSSICCMTVAKTSNDVQLVIGTTVGTIRVVRMSLISPSSKLRSSSLKRTGAINAHDGKITTLQASFEGSILLSSSHDGNILLWDLETHALKHSFNFGQAINVASFSPNSLYCAFSVSPPPDAHVIHIEKLHVYNLQHGTQVCSPLTRHKKRILCLSLDPRSSRTLASCAEGDRAISILRLERIAGEEHLKDKNVDDDDSCYLRLEGHERDVTQVLHDCSGRTLFTSSLDAAVRVWSMVTGDCLYILQANRQAVFNIALSFPNREGLSPSSSSSPHALLAAVASSGEINVWEVEERRCRGVCKLKDFVTKQMEGRRAKLCDELIGRPWYHEHRIFSSPLSHSSPSSPHHRHPPASSSAVADWVPYSHGRRVHSLLIRVSLSDPLVEWERARYRRRLMVQKRKEEEEKERQRLPQSQQRLMMRFRGTRREEDEEAMVDPLTLEQSTRQRQEAVAHVLSLLLLSSPGHLRAKVALLRLLQAEDEVLRALGALGLGLLGNGAAEEEVRRRLEEEPALRRREEDEDEETSGKEDEDGDARRKEERFALWQRSEEEAKKVVEKEEKCDQLYTAIVETSRRLGAIEVLLTEGAETSGGNDFMQESLRVENHKQKLIVEEKLSELHGELEQLFSEYLQLQAQHAAGVDVMAIRAITVLLRETSTVVLRCAVSSLAFLCPRGMASVVRLVVPLLSHADDEVRELSSLCIGKLSRGARDCLFDLLRCLQTAHVSKDAILATLNAAAFVLRNRPEGLVDERDRLLHFFQYLQHPDKEIREAAKRLSGYMAADENQEFAFCPEIIDRHPPFSPGFNIPYVQTVYEEEFERGHKMSKFSRGISPFSEYIATAIPPKVNPGNKKSIIWPSESLRSNG